MALARFALLRNISYMYTLIFFLSVGAYMWDSPPPPPPPPPPPLVLKSWLRYCIFETSFSASVA